MKLIKVQYLLENQKNFKMHALMLEIFLKNSSTGVLRI